MENAISISTTEHRLKDLDSYHIETSRKWLTVAIFRKWHDSSVALWIEIAVILSW